MGLEAQTRGGNVKRPYDFRRTNSKAENEAQQILDFNYKEFVRFGVSIGIQPFTYNLRDIFDALVKDIEKKQKKTP